MKEISILDFPIKSKRDIYIKFEKEYSIYLIKKLRKNFKSYEETGRYLSSKSKHYGFSIKPNRDCIYSWIKRERFPLWVIKEISKICSIPKGEIDKKVIQYGLWSPTSIIKPKLPIKIDPIFVSLIGNLLGDGCASKKYSPLYYAQFKKEYAQIFLNKIEYVFGKFGSTKKENFKVIKKRLSHNRDCYEIKLPHFIKDILEKYSINSNWYTKTSKLPNSIFKENKRSRVAFLTSIIIDEGCIADNGIFINLVNKNLVKGIKKLTESLEYISNIKIRKNQKGNYYQLKIYSKYKLLKDIELFVSKYNNIMDGFEKYEELKRITNPDYNKNIKNIKEIIINSIKNPKTVKELSEELSLRGDKISYHLNRLKEKSLVKTLDKKVVFGGYQLRWVAITCSHANGVHT